MPPFRKPARASVALVVTSAVASAALVGVTTTLSPTASATPIGGIQPGGLVAEKLTAASFEDPSDVARPQYRYWVTDPPDPGGLDDATLRSDIAEMADLGAGGVELAALGYGGSGGSTAEGWGSQSFARAFNTVLQAAEEEGLEVSGTIGPAWPARIPTVNSPTDPRASQGLYAASTTVTAGSPASAAPVPLPTGQAAGSVPRIVALVAAQCVNATCAPTTNPGPTGTARTTVLDRSTARTVAVTEAGDPALDTDDTFSFTPPAASGSNAWAVMAFWQATESGPSNGYAGPMYLVDHLSEVGASVVTDFWDTNLLTYGEGETSTRALIDRLGGIQLFEDSLELSDRLKWTDDMVAEWTARRGYDPTLTLPALANTGAQSCDSFTPTQSGANGTAAGTGVDCGVPPAFDFSDGSGAAVRRDYRQTFSDLYIDKRLRTLQAWGDENKIRIKAQPYGEPIDIAAASTVLDVPEGESLAFVNSPEYYKVVAVGAHMSGANAVSTECCAIFRTPYGVDLATRLGYVQRAYAGGVTTNVWHGYSYNRPTGSAWPGWHAFGTFVDEAQGSRNANVAGYAEANEFLARTQLALRQGQPRFDVGVYWEDFGLKSVQGNGNNLGPGTGSTFNEGTVDAPDIPNGSSTVSVKTRMNENGYTYEYVSPEHLDLDAATWDGERLFPDRSAYKAFVVNSTGKTSMRLDAIQRILAWARNGLPVVLIGNLPTTAPGLGDQANRSAAVRAAANQLKRLVDDPAHRVRQVGSEAYVPGALRDLGIEPSAEPQRKSPALLPVRRQDGADNYYYLFNQSGSRVSQDVTLEGTGQPYLLDAVSGDITPIAEWTQADGRVTVPVSVGAQQSVLVALAPDGIEGVSAPAVHVTDTDADQALHDGSGALVVRTRTAGPVATTLADGRTVNTAVRAPGTIELGDVWDLTVESWTPETSTPDPRDTRRTVLTTRQVAADQDGNLPSWRDVAGVGERVSGIGTYTQTFTSDGFAEGTGAYLDLGTVSDTVRVLVNGEEVPVDLSNTGRIDIGPWLVAGSNTLTVEVASKMLNAVKATGVNAYASQAYNLNGLLGPVRTTAYRQTAVDTSVVPPTPAPAASTTKLAAKPRTQVRGARGAKRIRLTATVRSSGATNGGTVQFRSRGRVLATATVRGGKATVLAPRTLRVGSHRVVARFTGTAKAKPSTSAAVVVRVTKRR